MKLLKVQNTLAAEGNCGIVVDAEKDRTIKVLALSNIIPDHSTWDGGVIETDDLPYSNTHRYLEQQDTTTSLGLNGGMLYSLYNNKLYIRVDEQELIDWTTLDKTSISGEDLYGLGYKYIVLNAATNTVTPDKMALDISPASLYKLQRYIANPGSYLYNGIFDAAIGLGCLKTLQEAFGDYDRIMVYYPYIENKSDVVDGTIPMAAIFNRTSQIRHTLINLTKNGTTLSTIQNDATISLDNQFVLYRSTNNYSSSMFYQGPYDFGWGTYNIHGVHISTTTFTTPLKVKYGKYANYIVGSKLLPPYLLIRSGNHLLKALAQLQPTTITFGVATGEWGEINYSYTCEEGMTFGEFVNSSYNPTDDSRIIIDNGVLTVNATFEFDDGTTPSTVIQADREYSAMGMHQQTATTITFGVATSMMGEVNYSYTCEEGMTFEEFVNSSYNPTDGSRISIDNGVLTVNANLETFEFDDGTTPSTVIQADREYSAMGMHQGGIIA